MLFRSHEAVHAVLSKILANPNHSATKEFQSFFDEIQKQLGSEYGGDSVQEFAAEFISNGHFQALVKNIQTPKKQSMFSAIIDAIARALGFGRDKSAYDAAVKHLNNVLDIADKESVRPSVQMAQGTGAAVSEAFKDLAESTSKVGRVPRAMLKSALGTISNIKNGGVQRAAVDALSLHNLADKIGRAHV